MIARAVFQKQAPHGGGKGGDRVDPAETACDWPKQLRKHYSDLLMNFSQYTLIIILKSPVRGRDFPLF